MNNKKYNKRLYAICKDMIQNKEKFRDLEIYKYLDNPSIDRDNKIDQLAGENVRKKAGEINHALVLHNKLLPLLNFLTGIKNEEEKFNENSAKGSDIMPSLNISNMKDETLAEILAFYCHILEKNNNGRMFKTNVDIENSLNIVTKYFNLGESDFANHFNFVWSDINFKCRDILQSIIRLIIRNKANPRKKESMMKINNIILGLIKEEKRIHKVQFINTSQETLFLIYLYYYVKNLFLQNIDILKLITKKKRTNPPDSYSLFSFSSVKQGFTWGKLQEFFCEGDKEYMKDIKTFKSRILEIYKGIKIFNGITLRKLANYEPVSLKAVYKEIYLDDTLYKGVPSKTIFHKVLELDTPSISDIYFLNEKINMGVFREYGLIEEFYIKNEIQENLYYLVCLILAKLDPDDIKNSFDRSYKCIMYALKRILAQYPYIFLEVEQSKEWKELVKKLLIHENNLNNLNNQHIFEGMFQCFNLYNFKFEHGEI